MSTVLIVPKRPGTKPSTTPATPHQQLDQNAPAPLQEQLWLRMAGLDLVRTGPSTISLADTRALHLNPAQANGPQSAFVPGSTEFAHLHADGSLHITVPEEAAADVVAKGWGEVHPIVRMGIFPPTLVMVYGPRDTTELELVWRLVLHSYDYARGASTAAGGRR